MSTTRELPRVLHIIGPMTVGGAQTQLLGLVRAAHEVHWHATICATSPGPLVEDFRSAGVEVIVLRRWASPGLLRILKLRRFVSRGGFDVINGHLWQGNAYARLAACLRRRRPAVVIVEHNVEIHRNGGRRLVDRILARCTDGWVAVTEAMHEFIDSMHPTERGVVERIPYGIDKSVFRPAPERRRASGPWKVGSIGRLDPEKGYAVLIEAVREALREGRELTVQVAGVGPLKESLEAEAVGLPVRFIGRIEPGVGVAQFLRSLDVFVLPSTHREARPVVVLEAMCCGVPVVVTDIPGMLETTGGGGTLVPPSDAGALARGLMNVLDDPNARTMALKGAQKVPSFEEVAERYASLFARLIDR